MPIDYSLYLIADPKACAPRPLITAVEAIIEQGITCVQLRIKNQPLETVLNTAKQLHRLLKPKNIPLIINDFIEIAQAIDAEGVHIGQTDKPYTWVRQQLGYKKIIGLSIENIQQAERCKAFDCDYFGVGPIFTTSTKANASPPIGIANLKKITTMLTKPSIAIGGINQTNIKQVLTAPVSGIALAAGIFSTVSPKLSTQGLSQIISQSFYDKQKFTYCT